MINMEGTKPGLIVKNMREIKGISRMELSALTGLSESYLKKIESGIRQPTIQTYQKMIEALEADIVIRNMTRTVKGDCTARAQKVFLESTESQAVFLVRVLEYMAQNMKTVK